MDKKIIKANKEANISALKIDMEVEFMDIYISKDVGGDLEEEDIMVLGHL